MTKKNIFVIIILILALMFCSCRNTIIVGTASHSLDDEIEEIVINENLAEYDKSYIQYKWSDTIGEKYSNSLNTKTTKLFYISDGTKYKITKIECMVDNSEWANEAVKYFKKNYHLEKKLEEPFYYANTQYHTVKSYYFNDKYTDNKLIVYRFDKYAVIDFISPKFSDNYEFKEELNKYKEINGTDGFILGMSKDHALKNISKINFKIIDKTNYNGIERIWCSHYGNKKELFYINPYDYEEKAYFNKNDYNRKVDFAYCLDFIENKQGAKILSNGYLTEYYFFDYPNKRQVFEDIIQPLVIKYHLNKITSKKLTPNDGELTYSYLFNDVNYNQLKLTLYYNNGNFLKIQIEYSLDDKYIIDYLQQLESKEKEEITVQNNSILDRL